MQEYLGSVAPAMATSLAEMAMETDAEAIMADSSSGAGSPVGRRDVSECVPLPGQVDNVELPEASALLEAEEAQVGDGLQRF